MSYYYNKYKNIVDDTIEDIFNYNGNVDTTLFTDLEFDFEVSCIVDIIKSSKRIIKEVSAIGDDIQLPYIGTIKIKEGTKIANTIKEEIAIKYNYKCYKDIPNKIKFELKLEISELMKVEMMKLKMNKRDYKDNKIITNINIFKLAKNKSDKT